MTRFRWPIVLTVLAVSLVIGSLGGDGESATPGERIDRIAADVRCPTCAGLSVAESDSPLAQSAREEISKRVAAGQTDQEIRDFFVSVYGDATLLSPPKEGLTLVAWVLPVMAAAAGVALAAYAVGRWRRRSSGDLPTDEDRALVEEALERRP